MTHGLRFAVAVAVAGILGMSLFGLPTEASGKTKSKKSSSSSKSVSKTTSRTSKASSPRTTSPRPDYKSKYKKNDPPANGGRPTKKKYKPPTREKTKPPRGGGDRQRPIRPPAGREILPPGDGPDPVYIIEPIYVPGPVFIVDNYQDSYYEEPGYYDSEPDYSGEDLSLVFTAGSMVLNYVFIRSGQTNEFAAGTGFVFGVASIAIASRSNSKHAFLDYLAGVAAIGFSVWNLSGGMSQNDAYGETDPYEPYAYSTDVTAGQTVGWSFSF